MTYQYAGLNKQQFLHTNEAALLAEINATNQWLGQQHANVTPLTKADFWVIVYCEAGIQAGGNVDPDFHHSAGERGLLPLPSNITFWVGNTAPPFDQPMPLEVNIPNYMRYLGQIKNKSVRDGGGYDLYRELFTISGIAGAPIRQAKLVAGIVHGYFLEANYENDTVGYANLVTCYKTDVALTTMMAGSTYKRMATLPGRQTNIKDAVTDLSGGGAGAPIV